MWFSGISDKEREDWGEPPPFLFVRLSFIEGREKINKKRTAGSNQRYAIWFSVN